MTTKTPNDILNLSCLLCGAGLWAIGVVVPDWGLGHGLLLVGSALLGLALVRIFL